MECPSSTFAKAAAAFYEAVVGWTGKEVYQGKVSYARDAFEGLRLMDSVITPENAPNNRATAAIR